MFRTLRLTNAQDDLSYTLVLLDLDYKILYINKDIKPYKTMDEKQITMPEFKDEFNKLLDAYLEVKIEAKEKGYDENAFKFKDFKEVYIASLKN